MHREFYMGECWSFRDDPILVLMDYFFAKELWIAHYEIRRIFYEPLEHGLTCLS